MALRIMDVLDSTSGRRGDAPALRSKRDGVWQTTSWRDYREQVRQAARALMALGVAPRQCITITAFNCPEWFLSDLGAIHAGAIPVGIYTTSTAEQSRYIVHHCEAGVAVVEDAAQLAKVRSVWPELPHLRAVVLIDGEDDDPRVYSWAKFLSLAERVHGGSGTGGFDSPD